MRPLNSTLLDNFNKNGYAVASLVSIDNGDVRLTDWSAPVFYNGNTFFSRGMKADPVRSGNASIIDSFTINIDDVSSEIYTELTTKPPLGVPFEIHLGAIDIDSNRIISGSVSLIYKGYVDSWQYRPGAIRITVVSLFSQWAQVSLSLFSASCRWRVFKGTECSYSGGNSACDRSYANCASLANTRNFGGFRWLTSIGKDLRIGREVAPMRWRTSLGGRR